MPGGKRYPAGPLSYVAVGLLVMTWASIRLWQPAQQVREVAAGDSTAPFAAGAKQAAISRATNAITTLSTDLPARSSAALQLEELTTMPMVAELAPPVATRIEFDPVMAIEPEVHIAIDPPLDIERSELPETRRVTIPQFDLRIARANTDRAPELARAWTYPLALVEPLRQLQRSPIAGVWAKEVLLALDSLFAADSLSSDEARDALARLEVLSDAGRNVQCTDNAERVLKSRAAYGLTRRLLVWRQAQRLSAGNYATTPVSTENLTAKLEELDKHFATAPTWKKFLLLSQLDAAVVADRSEQAALARRVLARLENPKLSEQQQSVLNKPPVTELAAILKSWAAEPVQLPQLLASLEEMELGENSQAAQQVALAWQQLRWSQDAGAVKLADDLNTYYRNANVRVAISENLLNMLLPQQPLTEEPVNDQILGARVFGRSQTSSRLRVVLLPDMRRIRLGIEAIGDVDSDTAATKGPATLYSQGNSHFHARKMLSIDRQGLRVWRSQAEVATDNYLTDVETDFDALPFVGMLARAMAQREHDESYYEASHEIRGRVASRAENRFDSEVHKKLQDAEKEFLEKIYQPLERLHLEPTALDLRTTREQLVARYRVAGSNQLAAYTPRPTVPDNSVLNIQLHQSTLNNVLEQLKLDGRRISLEELYSEISKTFNQPLTKEMIEDLPEKVTVEFAQNDAVRVHCDSGRLLLVIKLAELSQGRTHKWKDFTIRAYYVPSFETIDAKLIREGTIELSGEQLNFRDQIALRGIFTKVLSKNRTFNLVQEKFARDPRLKSLKIDQFTIDDGWIGLSVTQPKTAKAKVAGEGAARR
jgi:hypothetical protein